MLKTTYPSCIREKIKEIFLWMLNSLMKTFWKSRNPRYTYISKTSRSTMVLFRRSSYTRVDQISLKSPYESSRSPHKVIFFILSWTSWRCLAVTYFPHKVLPILAKDLLFYYLKWNLWWSLYT